MKFSIIIPAYNVAPYIRACLESVLMQSCSDWEALCVDDGSTDGTSQILDEYALKDTRIRVFHKKNTGVSDTRNKGADLSQGEYLAFLDADDYWYPDHLTEALSFFRQYPRIRWYAANQFCVPFGTIVPCDRHERKYHIDGLFQRGKDYVNSTNLIIEKKLFHAVGGYPTSMKHFEDHYLYCSVAELAPYIGTNCRETSVYYQRSDSVSHSFSGDIERLYLEILDKILISYQRVRKAPPFYPFKMVQSLLKLSPIDSVERAEELLTYLERYYELMPKISNIMWCLFVRYCRRKGLKRNEGTTIFSFNCSPLRRLKEVFSLKSSTKSNRMINVFYFFRGFVENVEIWYWRMVMDFARINQTKKMREIQ